MLAPTLQHRLLGDHLCEVLRGGAAAGAEAALWGPFERRLRRHVGELSNALAALYGSREDFMSVMERVAGTAWAGWAQRPAVWRELDQRREERPDWFTDQSMVGAVCYADLWAGGLKGLRARIPELRELGVSYLHVMPPFLCPQGNSDGGYAVSSYRQVQPGLGQLEDLRALALELHAQGISLCLDFIFNHTSNEHEWAQRAVQGQSPYDGYFLLFPDRTLPDAYDRTVREIFPDQHPGAFTQLPDGRWVWTTFNSFQWDLNYANPLVFDAMAAELLFIANLGTEILRMDAVAFVWKQLGTTCENLPQAHQLIRAYNALARIAAPSLLFKSEAIVHPDEVVRYIDAQECQLSYNPLQMALLWNSLATREVNLLQQALTERHQLPQGTSWVNYVRCHDDIGWTFADEDAQRLGINGYDHRQFLNRFYVNRFPGSFARGVPFQDNPVTGDCRISGTCASLCGLEQGDPLGPARVLLLHGVAMAAGGIPLIYLGDEVGVLNDYGYRQDANKVADSRWVHRPAQPQARYDEAQQAGTDAHRIHSGLRRQIQARQSLPGLAGNELISFWTHNPHVLGFLRGHGDQRLLVLANFSEHGQAIAPEVFSSGPAKAVDALSGQTHALAQGLSLPPYGLLWLNYPTP
ncbi:MAG: alpha-amylase family glycosyl hydrolase [Betaproteobacteria bacterium]|jgi:amylosucrase